MTAALLASVGSAMLLVRIGWGDVRGRHVVAAGWVVAGLALVALTLRDGAWGLAIGGVAGMASALALVLHAAWRAPARARRAPRTPPSIAGGRRLHLPRRLAVFVLVVPVAFAAAQWFAFGVQAIARRAGMGEADAIVTTLFVQPVAWTVVMAIQMTRADAPRMIAPPVVAAMIGTLLWSAS